MGSILQTLIARKAMESQSGDYAEKLLQAQSHVWNHIFSFINSMSLKCAVDLAIPDAIHNYGKPMPLSKLIASLSIHPSKTSHIHRLMRKLVHSGFFSTQNTITQNDDDELEVGYVLTDASMLLLKDNPLSMTPFLLSMVDPTLTKPWHQMSTWFKNDDRTPFVTEHGMMMWEYAAQVPEFNDEVNEGLASDTRLVSSVVIDKCKGVFEGFESLVDVGGGTGTMAKAIAKTFPKMDCTVFDLPHVIAGLEGTHNLKYVGGDMFKAIPPSDSILFKWVLHDWSDEECLIILRNCKESIISKGKGGKVIIIDIVMEEMKRDYKSVETQLFFDMALMGLLTGKTRNEKEWAKLFFSSGFSDYKITPVLGLRSIIEVFP